ncbi:hypothetical protein SKAU_G00066200 [Synaphobranchus kaupii]|uniref:Uncharacterized protein n=1 Tax=Synaphobranchus kaupii TaxID=118154 RepID=A0A9Q1G7F2_SYNKA|nr:hypothetical protein SKAU_G00066200 [Synaphobranchus kaupii]
MSITDQDEDLWMLEDCASDSQLQPDGAAGNNHGGNSTSGRMAARSPSRLATGKLEFFNKRQKDTLSSPEQMLGNLIWMRGDGRRDEASVSRGVRQMGTPGPTSHRELFHVSWCRGERTSARVPRHAPAITA